MDSKIDKQLALEIWLGLYGPIDEKWHEAFLTDRDLDYICGHFTVEQITEAFGRWKRLEDARESLVNRHKPDLKVTAYSETCVACGFKLGHYGQCGHCGPAE